MAAEHAPAFVDDLARPGRARRKMVDHTRIIAVGHEADVLAVRLFRDSESKVRGQRTHARLLHPAERKAQHFQLGGRRAEEKIALVALDIGGTMQLRTARTVEAPHVMTCRQRVGAEILCHFEQIGELDALVAQHTGNRREPLCVRIRKRFHNAGTEAVLVIEHVMGNAQASGHAARILHVLSRAARALLLCRRANIVKLQRHADNVVAFSL